MSTSTIRTALVTYSEKVDVARQATTDATDALRDLLTAFGKTSVGDKRLAQTLTDAEKRDLPGKSHQYMGNLKKIGKQVVAGRLVVDTYDPKALAKVSGKAQNAKGWNAYWANLDENATVSLSALADADDLESATTKKTPKEWNLRDAVEALIKQTDKNEVSREAVVAMVREVATPTLAAVPGEAA